MMLVLPTSAAQVNLELFDAQVSSVWLLQRAFRFTCMLVIGTICVILSSISQRGHTVTLFVLLICKVIEIRQFWQRRWRSNLQRQSHTARWMIQRLDIYIYMWKYWEMLEPTNQGGAWFYSSGKDGRQSCHSVNQATIARSTPCFVWEATPCRMAAGEAYSDHCDQWLRGDFPFVPGHATKWRFGTIKRYWWPVWVNVSLRCSRSYWSLPWLILLTTPLWVQFLAVVCLILSLSSRWMTTSTA